MLSEPATLLERMEVLGAARAALDGLGAAARQADPDDLAAILGALGELQAAIAPQMVVVIAHAEATGVVERSQCASTRGWVAEAAWHIRAQAGVLAKTAAILRRPELTPVADAVLSLDVTPAVAVTIAEQFDKTIGHLVEGSDDAVLDRFIEAGAEHGSAEVRRQREFVIAQFGELGSFQEEQDRCKSQIHLSAGRETADGVHQYELTIDPEGRAHLEAAIGRLSAPAPGPDGAADPRSVGRRRGEALIEALRRSVSTAARPKSAQENVMVVMELDDLRDRIGAGTVVGTRAQNTLLAPETVRRLACNGGIIPLLLGSDGQIVDLGRKIRLFDRAQTRALWFRDRHCTFPGCGAPAAWCRGHHLIHWVDGGPTNLDNAALLCERHHTVVHRDELAGRSVAGKIVWDREPGSYRRLLTEVRRT